MAKCGKIRRIVTSWLRSGAAADGVFLYWWARDRSERTKNAAITGLGFKECVTVLALIEKDAGVKRHDFGFAVAAFRTGQL